MSQAGICHSIFSTTALVYHPTLVGSAYRYMHNLCKATTILLGLRVWAGPVDCRYRYSFLGTMSVAALPFAESHAVVLNNGISSATSQVTQR